MRTGFSRMLASKPPSCVKVTNAVAFYSKISLVDLAGSERAGKSGTTGALLKVRTKCPTLRQKFVLFCLPTTRDGGIFYV